jgi:pyruvate dehydrogenase E1 component alpha subunit
MLKSDLIAFEDEVRRRFEAGQIHGPVHLSNGNEDQLIGIFADIKRGDWVLSTWRNHYHALLHGVPAQFVMDEIMAGRSISLNSREHRFLSSAIVGGMLPIAVGLAAAGERVWCFVGDMAASCGMFHDCVQYAQGFNLPATFIVEDNGLATTTPTAETWGAWPSGGHILHYDYKSELPHIGAGKRVTM